MIWFHAGPREVVDGLWSSRKAHIHLYDFLICIILILHKKSLSCAESEAQGATGHNEQRDRVEDGEDCIAGGAGEGKLITFLTWTLKHVYLQHSEYINERQCKVKAYAEAARVAN